MATAAQLLADPELLESAWDLTPIVNGEGTAGVERLLDEALERGANFAETYTGKIATIDAAGLREAMLELAAISERVDRAGSYAMLEFTTDTADPARGALLQQVQERGTQLETQLLFFELEWAALDDERVEALLNADVDLEFCAHHLLSARRYRPHLLTEPEEKVMAEKSLASSSAWSRLFGEQVSAIRVSVDGDEAPLDMALSNLLSPDLETRRRTAEAVTAALEPGLRTRAFIFNTLIYDKSVDDRLRKYPHWLAARNLANEASDESVLALIHAVRGRYDIPQRWYRLKARLLGVEKLKDYDRSATVASSEPLFSYRDSRDLVVETYASFSPQAGAIARRFFDENWIDAPVRENKRGGAFCATVAGVHPYVMLNYTARRRDVLTIAHELGHGLHSVLAEKQGIFHQSTPLTVAETASVFGETLVFERLLAESRTEAERLELLAGRIDDAVATVFRQMAMNRFEHLVHTRRRAEGELSAQDISKAWVESQSEMLGDAVEITEGYHSWWSYIPHFINTPGYVYAYAYGQLLALSVYGRYREVGEPLVPKYLEMLGAGGSRTPEQLGEIVGVDLADSGFWDAGLQLIDQQLMEAETLAERLVPAS
ncbi:MAG TPA: M3 family oligoendopeptidase [Solirubrobacteraceae bacterium]|jgi:oligoendopeptidase F|nr:M3 family oligoendopeptidase [Solirubrobacteraceae bacterium]